MIDTMLREAIELAQEGRKTEARWVLQEILRDDVTNESAWLWYADCGETRGDRVQALETCLRNNPGATRARAALDLLNADGETSYNDGMVAVTGGFGEEPEEPGPFLPVEIDPDESAFPASLLKDDLPFPVLIEEQGFSPEPQRSDADEWVLSGGANVFTVAPETVTEEDFSAIATRTETSLESRPLIRPVLPSAPRRKPAADKGWEEIAQVPAGHRAAASESKTSPAHAATMAYQRPRLEIVAFAVLIALVLLSLIALVGAAILLRLV